MSVLASQIIQDFQSAGIVDQLLGPEASFESIVPVSACRPCDLVFAEEAQYIPTILERKPAIIVTQKQLAQTLVDAGFTVITSGNVKLAHALLRQKYTDTRFHDSEWGKRHASAVIHDSAVVPDSCVVGPGVVIGRDTTLGKRCVVMANTVIEYEVCVGDDTIIHPNVTLGWGSKIGQRVFLHAGCVIGSEGYGYAQDAQRKNYRIPQQGIVIIEDDCTIGANNCIDRATFGETLIGSGCKFDNLIQIAHNVTLGKDCLILAQTGIAGSTELGDRVICTGQTGTLDHLKIASDVVLLHRAAVIRDIPEAGMYASSPLQSLSAYLKNTVILKKLTELKKSLRRMEKQVAAISDKAE